MTTTLTSREFNQDTSRAKRAAEQGPVFITDRGKVAHVLLSFAEYEVRSKERKSLYESLSMEEGAEIEFDPQPLADISVPAEFD